MGSRHFRSNRQVADGGWSLTLITVRPNPPGAGKAKCLHGFTIDGQGSHRFSQRIREAIAALAGRGGLRLESLDTTILNTAVPTIAKALSVAPLSMQAVLSSYTLSLALFIPISGWMADRFGTRRVFASAIGLFTLGSLLCGLSSNIHVLVACRILQGCGGAMMVPWAGSPWCGHSPNPNSFAP